MEFIEGEDVGNERKFIDVLHFEGFSWPVGDEMDTEFYSNGREV